MTDLTVTFTIAGAGDDLMEPGADYFDEPHEALWDRLFAAERTVQAIFGDCEVTMEVTK